MDNKCKTCAHCKPTYKGYRCEIKDKKTKLTDVCEKWAKRATALLLAVILATTPLSARAEKRDWWPTQVDEDDFYYDFKQVGKWPHDVTSTETIIETVTFRPNVISVVPYSKTTKITADITTAARLVIVRYTADGKHWEQKIFRNASYAGPVRAHRKWQDKWHSKDDHYSSWCARQFKQAGKTLDYKKTACLRSQMAQLYFDDQLIDYVRRKVKSIKVLNIPVRAKQVSIRYVYTGLHGNSYSEWEVLKVR